MNGLKANECSLSGPFLDRQLWYGLGMDVIERMWLLC